MIEESTNPTQGSNTSSTTDATATDIPETDAVSSKAPVVTAARLSLSPGPSPPKPFSKKYEMTEEEEAALEAEEEGDVFRW